MWLHKLYPQNIVLRAPLDMSGGGSAASNRRIPQADFQAPQGRPKAASVASLGNLRNTYAGDQPAPHVSHCKENEKDDSKQDRKNARRADRFDLQRVAARLTPSLRVAGCLWAAAASTVSLVKRAGDARFVGLQTCGSVWSCPCCSSRISEVRRQELRQLEEWAGSPLLGLRLVMMTLTARHRNRALSDMVNRLAKAKRRMQNRKAGSACASPACSSARYLCAKRHMARITAGILTITCFVWLRLKLTKRLRQCWSRCAVHG